MATEQRRQTTGEVGKQSSNAGDSDYDKKVFVHDALGRVKKVTDQKGDIVEAVYDLAGRMTGRRYFAASAPTTLVEEDTLTYDRASRSTGGTKDRYDNVTTRVFDGETAVGLTTNRGRVWRT